MIKCSRCNKKVTKIDENIYNNMCPDCHETSNQEYREVEAAIVGGRK